MRENIQITLTPAQYDWAIYCVNKARYDTTDPERSLELLAVLLNEIEVDDEP